MTRERGERAREREPSGLGRSKLLFRTHLGWLEGHPSFPSWQSVPSRGAPANVSLDASLVSRAVRTFRELVREHGAGVGRIVARADRVEPLLLAVGEALRGQRSWEPPWALFPPRVREASRAIEPPIAHALVWTFACEGREWDALRWAQSIDLAPLALDAPVAARLACVLARLAIEGAARQVASVLDVLGKADVLDVETSEGARVERLARRTLGGALVALCDDALSLPPASRRRALDLAECTAPFGWVARLVERRALFLDALRRKRGHELASRYAPKLGKAPKPELKPLVPTLDCAVWTATIRAEAWAADVGSDALTRLLRAMPDEKAAPGVRARLCVAFSRQLRGEPPKRFVELLTALATELERGAPYAAVLGPWAGALDQPISDRSPRTWHELDFDDVPRSVALRDVVRAYTALRLGIDGPFGSEAHDALLQLVEGGAPIDQAIAQAQRVPELLRRSKKSWMPTPPLVIASGLAGGDVARFSATLSQLLTVDGWGTASGPKVVAFARAVGVERALAAEIELGVTARAQRWSSTLTTLDPARVTRALVAPTRREKPQWLRDYPKALHGALGELNDAVSDGELRAQRVLGDKIRGTSALRREIAAIAARLETRDDQKLRKRLAALERRVAERPRPKARELDELREKLARAVDRERLDRADAALGDALLDRVQRDLGIAGRPSWWSHPRAATIVAAVSELGTAERKLGFALLARRSGPAPWLPHDLPANQRFLASMRARGIDPGPWLTTNEQTIAVSADRVVRLAFEDDPLEVLLMGEHFDTCLSLGSVNFYSAIVNASDVNKRVLFARSESTGRVMGRCLLALTDVGEILTFHPYAHDAKLGFAALVAAFAKRLAEQMGTLVVAMGHVAPLVAARWYDDGPRDLTGQLDVLREGSPLRAALVTIEPSALIARLEADLAPLPLDARTLPLVIALPEVEARPDLAVELAQRAFFAPRVPVPARVAVTRLLVNGGHRDLARELLRSSGFWDWLYFPCPECGRGCHPNLDATLWLLVQLDALATLRALRATRPRHVRRWEDEEDDRLYYAVLAHRLARRPARARRLCELGIRRGGHRFAALQEELRRL